MTEPINPELVLDSFTKINIDICFDFETDPNAYVITDIENNLFGEYIREISLPSSYHYLRPNIIQVRYGNIKSNLELSKYSLQILLDRCQNYIIEYCYSTNYLSDLIAYISKISYLIEKVLNRQTVNIKTVNSIELENAGYSPEKLSAEENSIKNAIISNIKSNYLNLFHIWVQKLQLIIPHSNTLKTAKKALHTLTGIKDAKISSRKSRVQPSYILRKSSYEAMLPLIREKLIESKLIGVETTEKLFKNAFTGTKVSEKIRWTGGIGNLGLLLEVLKLNSIIDSDTINATAALVFEIEGKDISRSLGWRDKSKKPSKITAIEQTIKDFKRRLS